jgi:MFS family permease
VATEQAGRPARRGALRAAPGLLRRNRDFRRLFLASVISLGGDWFLFVAVGSLIVETTERALVVGLAIACQELAFFAASPVAGVLADRLDRRRLMIACDLARSGACLGFLAVGETTLWLAFPLLAVLSMFAAPFDAASTAAIPNLVAAEDLPVANALAGSLWGTMLAIGAALGGAASFALGHDAAFWIDAASFLVSAALIARIRGATAVRDGRDGAPPSLLSAALDTVRYARGDRRVVALLAVKGGFGFSAGVLALIPVFAHRVFGAGEVGFGLLMAARGVGALVGPFLGHRISGARHERLWQAIGLSLLAFGLGYLALGLAPALWVAALAILFAHLGGGSQWVLSTFGLQVLVPDRIRGRVFGLDFALITLSLALSSVAASAIADAIGPRRAAFILAGVAVAWSVTWWVATRSARRAPLELAPPSAEPPPHATIAIE